MPAAIDRDGIRWLRPWLSQPARAIEHYVHRHRLAHVEDPSNRLPELARSRLRQAVMPALTQHFAHAVPSLCASAARAHEAQQCLVELARLDLATLCPYVDVEHWGWHRRPPGGESPGDVWDRVRPALAEIAADPAPALLIAHRALMRVILARAWDWNYDSPEPFRIKRARLYPLILLPDGTPTAPEDPDKLIPLP
jgi:hypothetical protein